jgi:hypothetical protein
MNNKRKRKKKKRISHSYHLHFKPAGVRKVGGQGRLDAETS